MSSSLEKAVSGLLALAALAVIGSEVKRMIEPQPVGQSVRQSAYQSGWRSMLSAANMIGEADAPVIVTVFTDFQCPFCRRFHDVLATVTREFPNSISTAVIHLPLTGHQHAEAAARAAECAGNPKVGGSFARAVDELYANQDSIGKWPWSRFALHAGASDTIAFIRCMADTADVSRVRRGAALAAQEGFTATPTVLLNGWHYGAPPTDTELVRAVRDIVSGRQPYKGFPRSELASPKSVDR